MIYQFGISALPYDGDTVELVWEFHWDGDRLEESEGKFSFVWPDDDHPMHYWSPFWTDG